MSVRLLRWPDSTTPLPVILMTLLEPSAPHDALTFEELSNSYNFRNISDRRRTFTRLLVDELKMRSSPTVLDIGCGTGMGLDTAWQWEIRRHANCFLGVEPDKDIQTEPKLFDHVYQSSFEDANIPENSIDIAYSFLVMEHVENPEAFMRSLLRCLKPGAIYFFVTPNGKHYFTRIAKLLKRLHLSEFALRLVKQRAEIDEYHYPVQYRFNEVTSIEEISRRTGFCPPSFAFVEKTGPISYFPGPTKTLFYLLSIKRILFKNPNCLLTMIGRIQRPPGKIEEHE